MTSFLNLSSGRLIPLQILRIQFNGKIGDFQSLVVGSIPTIRIVSWHKPRLYPSRDNSLVGFFCFIFQRLPLTIQSHRTVCRQCQLKETVMLITLVASGKRKTNEYPYETWLWNYYLGWQLNGITIVSKMIILCSIRSQPVLSLLGNRLGDPTKFDFSVSSLW